MKLILKNAQQEKKDHESLCMGLKNVHEKVKKKPVTWFSIKQFLFNKNFDTFESEDLLVEVMQQILLWGFGHPFTYWS